MANSSQGRIRGRSSYPLMNGETNKFLFLIFKQFLQFFFFSSSSSSYPYSSFSNYSSNLLMTRQALVPPNPNEFFIAIFTCCSSEVFWMCLNTGWSLVVVVPTNKKGWQSDETSDKCKILLLKIKLESNYTLSLFNFSIFFIRKNNFFLL